jgi:hypothetical protein
MSIDVVKRKIVILNSFLNMEIGSREDMAIGRLRKYGGTPPPPFVSLVADKPMPAQGFAQNPCMQGCALLVARSVVQRTGEAHIVERWAEEKLMDLLVVRRGISETRLSRVEYEES